MKFKYKEEQSRICEEMDHEMLGKMRDGLP